MMHADIRWVRCCSMIVLLALALAGAQAATAQPRVVPQAAAAAQAAAGPFGSYAVQVTNPHVATVGSMAGQLAAERRAGNRPARSPRCLRG